MTDPKNVRKWLATLAHAYPSLLVSGVAYSALAEIERLEALSDPETTKQIEGLNAEVSAYKDAVERLEAENASLLRAIHNSTVENTIALEALVDDLTAKLAIAVEALERIVNDQTFLRADKRLDTRAVARNALAKIKENTNVC